MGSVRWNLLLCVAGWLLLNAGAAQAAPLYLSVCASMTEVFRELAESFSARHPGYEIRLNIGASGALARQIEQGAPADLFVSANPVWMDYLQQKELIADDSLIVLARNRLVFAGRPERRCDGPEGLGGLERIAIGNPDNVPAGHYAREALTGLGLYETLRAQKRLILAKDVRQALMYADRGEVDGAFVYLTDARLSRHSVIHFVVDAGLHSPIVYPLGLTARGAANPGARLFHDFLKSRETTEILLKQGFEPDSEGIGTALLQ